MAIQSALKFSGTIGDIIFYRRLGTYCMRAKPGSVKQAPASKQTASIFGQASRLSKSTRSALAHFIPGGQGKALMYALDAALRQWLQAGTPGGSIQQLQYFNLNNQCSFNERYKPTITVTTTGNGTTLHIPAIDPLKDITSLKGTAAAGMEFTVLACRIEDASVYNVQQYSLAYNYKQDPLPARSIVLPVTAEPGSLLLAAAALRYKTSEDAACCMESALQPAAIIDAIY